MSLSIACLPFLAPVTDSPISFPPPPAQVTGKFNLSELYEKIGYNKQTISR